MSFGRFDSPRGPSPDAIAPDVTHTISFPSSSSSHNSPTSFSMRAGSIRPFVRVSDVDPIFTTMRLALWSVSRIIGGPLERDGADAHLVAVHRAFAAQRLLD